MGYRVLSSAVLCSTLTLAAATTHAVAQPQLLRDVNRSPLRMDSLCGMPVVSNGTAFFCGAGDQLWKTDGTVAGTQQVYAFNRRFDPNDATAIDGELYFTNYWHELWRSDGTARGTRLVKDLPQLKLEQDAGLVRRDG